MKETKALVGVEVKSESKGVALIKFAAYDEVDRHGDVTLKGAFKQGQKVIVSSYNHTSWGGSLPVGKGVIRDSDDGKAAVADIEFFMHTAAGRETFETVKAVGDLQQWSYGFDIKHQDRGDFEGEGVRFLKELNVHEISPVLIGAGMSTGTLAVKNREGAMTIEKMRVAGRTNDQIVEYFEKAAPAPGSVKEDEEEKDGKGSNHSKECPPDCTRDHPKPSGKETENTGKMRMSDQCIEVLASVKRLADRAEEIVALRKADGKKGLAPDTAVLLDLVGDQLERLKSMANESPVPVVPDEDNTTADEQLILRSLKNLS